MRKKILFVINTLGHAGAEVAMLELMRRMDETQYEIELLVLMDQGELVHELPEHVKLLNKRYYDDSVLSKSGRMILCRSVLRAAFTRATIIKRLPFIVKHAFIMLKKKHLQADKLLWRVLSDGAQRLNSEYDLAIAYLEGGATYYVADYVRAKSKAAFVHIDYEKAGYSRSLDKNCYAEFNRVFTVSEEVREHFLRVYSELEEKTKVFHNLINIDEIHRKSKEIGGFSDDFDGYRLLTVGRLNYQKAYDISIEAMRLLKEKGYKARWYVLGEGNLRKNLEKQIEDAGLREDFILLGATKNPYPFFAQTDLYIHASRFEGKSIAIQEAQTLGCTIIASDCSGNREQIVNGVDGILCELTPQSIMESITELLDNKEKREELATVAKQKDFTHAGEMEELLKLI